MEPRSYLTVTELPGDDVTKEQVDRAYSRYYWAGPYCEGKDVVELGCGAGVGLGYLSRRAKKLVAGDISQDLLLRAKAQYGDRIPLLKLDAQNLPFEDHSQDVILLFEAIYYLQDVERFLSECRRVLRNNGRLLVVTANKDLFDFHTSAFSTRYYGVPELKQLFMRFGFETEFFGDSPVADASPLGKALRLAKKVAVSLGLMPKTMNGKKLLKRLVFGRLVPMPAEIESDRSLQRLPEKICDDQPLRDFKVIFCAGALKG